MHRRGPEPPTRAMNPLPPAVLGLAVVIFGVEVLFSLAERGLLGGGGGLGWRTAALRDYAFFGEAARWMAQQGRFPPDLVARFVTYPFLHLSLMHAVFSPWARWWARRWATPPCW